MTSWTALLQRLHDMTESKHSVVVEGVPHGTQHHAARRHPQVDGRHRVTYVTRKNRLTHPDRLVVRKYDPVADKHVPFREER